MNTVCIITTNTKDYRWPSGKLWCDSHWPAQNIILTSTGTAKAMGKAIPEMNGTLTGLALYIPIPNISVSDLTCCLDKAVKNNYIKKVVKHTSERSLKGILDYTKDKVAS
ncbi:glyceraldehyde-3-phosphate dehydrogenase-like [Arvicola amphibius]|uniref:glyceraldehyde-3-phosphate dehydrogenase-like n=1 Tax=Arvicola amphibius TaxID=1047088 RepID=UPI001C0875F3|nr:glyceraldehyde-3-phosphate dehydrogenase-like [Arvicola amphibius]